MRFSVNLATQPYQDAGRFYRRWLLALAVMTALSVVLVYMGTMAWRASREAKANLRQARQQLAQLRSWEKTGQEILDEPANNDVRERSEFLNDVIRRKAFSWTRVFSDLETIMPARLHVIAVRPEMTADNQLAVRMTVAGDSRDRALELVRRMEQSKSFRQPEVESESLTTEPPDTIKFEISALYSPQPQAAAAPAQAQARPPEGGK
jgi:type IV pilus assembly protein PilN